MGQREWAARLHIGERTLQLWEKSRVPPGKELLVLDEFGAYLQPELDEEGEGAPSQGPLPPLDNYSNMALLIELARRLEAAEQRTPPPIGATGDTPPNIGGPEEGPGHHRSGRRGARYNT